MPIELEEDLFADGRLGVVIWTTERDRRFRINVDVLDYLGAPHNPVHDPENVAFCRRHLARIKPACARAAARSADAWTDLMVADFQEALAA